MENETFIDRLLMERNELKGKRDKLELYLLKGLSSEISLFHQMLLTMQLQAMDNYLNILNLRIQDLGCEYQP
ncbi:MAG: hypothetical protein AAF634_05630 [Bacteroidota bacterium]